MNNLKIIEQRKVFNKDFKIYGTLEEPLFIAKDVADWIEHSNTSSMLNSIDEDEKKLIQVGTLNNAYSAWFLTEDGVYEVLMQSRKPIAKQFKQKVKEILKSIRKHGAYMTPETIEETLTNPDFIIGLATKLKEEQQARSEAEKQIQELKPKALFADAVSASESSVLIRELAKILKQNGIDMGQNRMFDWLRDNGFLIKKEGSDKNTPTQKGMDLGLFEIKETPIIHSSGRVTVSKTSKVTGKGQIYFINKFLKMKESKAINE